MGSRNHYLVQELRSLCSNISQGGSDKILWDDGQQLKVNISVIYSSIANHKQPPAWPDFIWHTFSVPRYAIIAWLVLQERLPKDRMLHFGMSANQTCVLCSSADETHSHILYDCPFSSTVLNACPAVISSSWTDFSNGKFLEQNYPALHKNIAILYISAAFYAIWNERNNHIFKNTSCNPSSLIAQIKANVREISFILATLSEPECMLTRI